jgi:hypothetical protein
MDLDVLYDVLGKHLIRWHQVFCSIDSACIADTQWPIFQWSTEWLPDTAGWIRKVIMNGEGIILYTLDLMSRHPLGNLFWEGAVDSLDELVDIALGYVCITLVTSYYRYI